MQANSWVGSVDCVSDGFELADAYARKPAHLVLIGHQSGRTAGVRATELLLSLHPTAAVIAFGPGDAGGMLTAAVARGARGLMLWEPTRPNQPRSFVGGWTAQRPDADGRPGQGPTTQLTERELQVLRGMSQGRSNADIGRDLFLSEDTVKTHARRLFNKLGARDRAHAVALGLRHSYVD